MKPPNEISLIAPCGMNCGLCMAFLREKNRCPGCREPDAKKPVTRVVCKIKTCAKLRKGKWKYCFKCSDFPCEALKHLDKRYRTRYHMSMTANLESIKKSGIKKFVSDEKIKWTCPKCGGTICVHKGYCYGCKKVIWQN